MRLPQLRPMRVFLALAGLGLVALCAVFAWRAFGPLDVEVAAPVQGPAVDAIYATGSVEPTVMLPIAPRVSGTLSQLLADEGAAVRKGQVLARLEDSDLAHTVDELAARARYAKENFDRTQDLVHRSFVSPGDLDRARSDLDAADASLRRAQAQRGFTELAAPADGVVLRRDGEVGQYFSAGQALFTISCCAPLRVGAEVDEEDIARVHVGQKVVLRTDALPDEVFEGAVSAVTPKGDPVARSYRVRIRLLRPGALRVGMTMDANLVVAERADAMLVPTAAVQAGKVWVVRDGRLHQQAVKTGVVGGERTEILAGLEAGARVVSAPSDLLREGRRARVASPAARAAASAAASAAEFAAEFAAASAAASAAGAGASG
jgi:RND family efflux transporter MFP subunit